VRRDQKCLQLPLELFVVAVVSCVSFTQVDSQHWSPGRKNV